jgi:atlastin
MSDTDESAVLVDAITGECSDAPPDLISEDATTTTTKITGLKSDGEACQIVSIGSDEDKYAFTYHEDKLQTIIQDIPPDCKVAIVSVVGAFRTGKSFLLSWFLRYLDYLTNRSTSTNAVDDEKKKMDDGTTPWYEKFQSLGNDGFEWRGGSERNTTGIWMWSRPHFITRASGEKLAILLVDTQGMFDNETTMAVTASIFGISTLLSSHQIYNVDKRIQEDNLQQLALFSEYARAAMGTDEKSRQSTASTSEIDEDVKQSKNDLDTQILVSTTAGKPFQRIEFLVRDWQHFDDDDDENYETMEKSMVDYLDKVISERDARDLQETREQILSCFEDIKCYGLCHPGTAVTKKKFAGDVNAIEKQFLNLLDRYCRQVFDTEKLQPKIIHGRELTAVELAVYIKAYAGLFASGASFPTAATMLDATAAANNTNAVRMAITAYKDEMSKLAGPRVNDYLPSIELEKEHMRTFLLSQSVFDSVANFGSKRSIEDARELFVQQIESDFEVFQSLNEGRNPLAGWET